MLRPLERAGLAFGSLGRALEVLGYPHYDGPMELSFQLSGEQAWGFDPLWCWIDPFVGSLPIITVLLLLL